MSVQVREFQPVIPAGTAKTSPFTAQLLMPSMNVDRVTIKVPNGPRGQMGFALGSSGVPVLPFAPGTWLVVDNFDYTFELDGYWNSGSWEFFGYNTGQFAHTVYLLFELSLVPQAPTVVVLGSNQAVSSSGQTSVGSGSAAPVAPTTPVIPPEAPEAPEVPPTVPAPPPLPTPPTVTIPPIPPITIPAPTF